MSSREEIIEERDAFLVRVKALLSGMEWSCPEDREPDCCPCCAGYKGSRYPYPTQSGHSLDCELSALLKELVDY